MVVVVKVAKQVMAGMVMVIMGMVMVIMVAAGMVGLVWWHQSRSVHKVSLKITSKFDTMSIKRDGHIFTYLNLMILPSAVQEGRLRRPKLLHLDRPQSKVTMTPSELNPPGQGKLKEV